jgi:hypothetical protein
MRRLIVTLVAAMAIAALGFATAAQGDPANYGIESVGASLTTTQAGGHADFTSDVTLKTENFELPALTRDISVELPQGLLANPTAVPKCSAVQFVSTDVEDKSNATGCPRESQVGVTHINFSNSQEGTSDFIEPVFNLQPSPGEPARLGFIALNYPILIDTELRPDYGVTAMVKGADTLATLFKTETTLWGVPAAEIHDGERMTPYEAAHNHSAIETPTGTRQSGLAPVPFMFNPTRCGVSLPLRATAVSYQLPDTVSEGLTFLSPMTGCDLLDFKPQISLKPTTTQAESGSGLNVKLTFPTGGFEHPNLLVDAEQRKAEVVLPRGMSVNPSQANGLSACSEAEFARESATSLPGGGCPESAKIGTVSARSPVLEETAEGSLYVATPHQNPFGSLIALYMVLKIPDRGVGVKLAGKVTLDPSTGQLVTTFDEIPQLPISSFELHFREGARSPLVTPSACGTYTSTATFTSWAGQVVTTRPSFEITSGANGGSCQMGVPPFRPGFEAGAISNSAGAYSPYYMRLTRSDGEQELTRFSSKLPPGSLAKLAGVSQCSDVAIAAAKARSGADELASPSCPAGSQIAHLLAGVGVGSALTYVPGRAYLAGPYQGNPLSVAAIVPAVAGPFDLGTVVVREGLRLEPETAQAHIDGSRSDPFPHILAGVPVKLRDVRVHVDRPNFTLNPTNCDREAFRAQIWGAGLDPFSAADDMSVSLSARFQAANCSRLGFKPSLALRLIGGTRRAAHPALRATLKARTKDANIGKAVVTLPHSAFLDQAHIRTVCTRVQFRAKACPAGSVYGRATAFSPLLDKPLRGPVYLRSSTHELPDLVVALHGIVDVDLVGRIDSLKGLNRTTFESVPDAPVSKFVLTMRGAKRGLIVNSRNLCAAPSRAIVELTGQNKKEHDFKPVVAAGCGSSPQSGHVKQTKSKGGKN